MSNSLLTKTSNHQIGKYQVQLFWRVGDPWWPHAFEVTQAETSNLNGYYAEGSLEIEDDIVTGYDGVYLLPLPVAIALADLGLGFAPFVFPAELAKNLLRL